MVFRKATPRDLEHIMHIITEAQQLLAANKIDQWQNGYPNKQVILDDIKQAESFVFVKDNEIIATTALSFRPEPTYNQIVQGSWLTETPYAVIHRIAIKAPYRGQLYAQQLFQQCETLVAQQGVQSIKIDTHPDNIAMQKLLHKCHFQYCGIIYLANNEQRLAFEKVLLRHTNAT